MAVKGGLLAIARDKIADLAVPAFIKDSQLRFVAVNTAFEDYCNIARADLLGRRLSDITGRVEDCAAEELERRVLVFGTEETALFYGGDDAQRCRAAIERFVTEDEALFVFGVFRDRPKAFRRPAAPPAAARRKAVAAPASGEALYLHVLEALPISILYIDSGLVIRYFNHREKKMAQEIGADLRIGMTYREMVEQIHAAGYYGDRPIEAVYRERLASLRADPDKQQYLRLSDGRVIAVHRHWLEDESLLLFYIDVTDAQKHERESQLYRAALENVPEPVFLRDRDRRLIFANAAMEQILGSDRQGFYGQTDEEMFPQHGRLLREESLALLATGEAMEREQVLVMPTGQELPLLISRKRLDDMEGGPFIVGTLADVSLLKIRERELIEARQQAEAADRAKSRFLGSITHEVRTPMNGVLGMAELLAASALDARQKTFVNVIVKSGRSLMTLINDLLEFSQIDEGRITLMETVFDPLDAAEDVVTLLSGAAAERHVELALSGRDLPYVLSGDAGRFRQMLSHLLRGCIQSSAGGAVTVELSARKTAEGRADLNVTVEEGLPGPVIEAGSLGLAQAMVRKLVTLFGGHMQVEPMASGGARFRLSLPFGISGPRAGISLPHALRGARVLVLASGARQGRMLADSLTEWGFDAADVSDARIARTLLEQAIGLEAPVDILLIDIAAEPSPALLLLNDLAQDPRFKTLAVVAVTFAGAQGPDLLTGSISVDAQLVRPVREGLLRETLVDVLRARKRQHRRPGARDFLTAMALPDMPGDRPPSPPFSPVSGRVSGGIDVLVVEDGAAERGFFRQVLREAQVAFELCKGCEDAMAVWRLLQPCLMLLDLTRDGDGAIALARRIREEERQDAERLPTVIVGMSTPVLPYDRRACLAAGMDDLIFKPLSPERVASLLAERFDAGRSERLDQAP
ncbi:PAS domain-containing protein [Allorhizobium undicola]|uniref:PAS domain-containing hybrid sensor histidine kinase/response regulator n=1 Tax=Allorhizobium undicola TaxID=78527 RepID=UPI003D35047A